jgi:hypothetical protein
MSKNRRADDVPHFLAAMYIKPGLAANNIAMQLQE